MIFYLLQTFTALHKHFCATFVIFRGFCCLTSLNQHVLKTQIRIIQPINKPTFFDLAVN